MNWWVRLLFLIVGLVTRSALVLGEEVKSGSGFIFHPDGYILTNNHVVTDSTEQIVVLANGNRVPAKIVATDPKTDVALLKIPGSNFPTLPIGESRKNLVMDTVHANINPGNSGGPLLNDRGEVIGIVVSKLNAMQLAKTMGAIPERINFAIPIDEARPMILMAYPDGFTPSHRTAPLRDQEIFAQSKDATVLILAPKKIQPAAPQANRSPSEQN